MLNSTPIRSAPRWRFTPAEQLRGPWYLYLDDNADSDQLNRDWQPLRIGAHSLLFQSQAPIPWLIKLIKPRSVPRDQLRKYISAQARREYIGGNYLRELGLTTPTSHGWGIALSPLSRFESVLFMEPLADFVSGLTLVRSERQSEERRRFLTSVAKDVAIIYGNRYIHKDCHFDNVCWLGDGRLAWVDTDIRRARGQQALVLGLRKSIELLRKTAGSHIENDEWRFFLQTINDQLDGYPNGVQLSHEIQ